MAFLVFNHQTKTSPCLDNFVFKLCYRWTVSILIVFTFIVTCRLLVGYSFSCGNNASGETKLHINIKCYDDVYTKPSDLIEEEKLPKDSEADKFKKYQTHYPWVNLLFLIQAFNFYLPHLLWKSYERGFTRRLTDGIQKFFDKEDKRELELCCLAKYVLITLGKHKIYTLCYIFFETLNCAVSLSHTLWLVHFFGVTGVPDFLPLSLETWTDFRKFYFPPSGTCNFQTIGASGYPQRIDAKCELPLNALYMVMFLFLYAWYIFITVLCGLVLVYRLALWMPSFRICSSQYTTSLAERSVLKSLCHRMTYSDWFFLTRMQKCMADVDFAQMLNKIAIISQGRSAQKDEYKTSLCENAMKDFDSSSITSPL